MSAYYNENDPLLCAWLSNLMDRGAIRPGVISDKSIVDLTPDDVRHYDLAHFFAGIAGWDYALTLAGWRFDGRVVWTGSCPCQPFSVAGQGKGVDDERHLWPAFYRLIRECRPATVFGEQVAGRTGLAWLDLVCADLEDSDYAVAAANLCAAGAGSPHIRQRLYWVAHTSSERRQQETGGASGYEAPDGRARREQRQQDSDYVASGDGADSGLADMPGNRCRQWYPHPSGRNGGVEPQGAGERPADNGARSWLGDPRGTGPQEQLWERHEPARPTETGVPDSWHDPEWLYCADGKYRPTQRGLFPLAHGLPEGLVRGGDRRLAPDADSTAEARVMRLRGYGNAVVPQLAAAFVRAAM